MRRYATVYYLLFVLLVMGAFASMAQNVYGLRICGIACLGFSLTFLHEFFFTSSSTDHQLASPWMVNAELILLSVLALIFLFRNFSSDIPFSDALLIGTFTGLLILFSYQAILHVKIARKFHSMLVFLIALYYGAVTFFILSFLSSIVLPGQAINLTLVAIVMIFVFASLTLFFKEFTVEDETISAWKYIRQLKNKATIVLIASLLISGYSLLYSAGILPSFYYGTPKGYQDLVNLTNARSDKQEKEKAREFKERYEAFIRKYSSR